MAKLTYANKVALNPQPSIARINKVTDDDMNEIKSVVNTNDDNTTANTTAITNLGNYSTTEVNTGKKWIDGKPIYRKMIQISVGTTEVTYSIANNISQAWIDMGSSWITWGGNRTYPLSRLMAEYYITNDLKLALKSVSGTNTGYVAVEYTKTTD